MLSFVVGMAMGLSKIWAECPDRGEMAELGRNGIVVTRDSIIRSDSRHLDDGSR